METHPLSLHPRRARRKQAGSTSFLSLKSEGRTFNLQRITQPNERRMPLIAIRYSVNVKVRCMGKALEMFKTFNQDVNGDYKGRIYTPAYGPHKVLFWEDF